MITFALGIWASIAPWWRIILSILSVVPKQVWYGLALVVGVALYGSYTAHKAKVKLRAQYAQEQRVEIARQKKVSDDAVKAANERLAVAEKRLLDVQRELDSAVEYAKNATNANAVCLPSDITDRLQSRQRRR